MSETDLIQELDQTVDHLDQAVDHLFSENKDLKTQLRFLRSQTIKQRQRIRKLSTQCTRLANMLWEAVNDASGVDALAELHLQYPLTSDSTTA